MRRPYSDYYDSGVEWLGKTPRHWGDVYLRRHLDIVNGGTPASNDEACWDGDAAWLTPDDLGRNSHKLIGAGRRSLTDHGLHSSSATLCPAGSVVVSTRAPIGHLAVTTVPAATNQGCRTLVPAEAIDCDYAYYTLLASRKVLEALGKGSTFMELTPSDLGSHRIPLPSLGEQRSISSFLDRETARIDKLITKQESLIERLDEYRTALVTKVVTKGLPPEAAEAAGLDPAPTLKDSGVEWLGEVPTHWEVSRLGWSLRDVIAGGTPDTGREDYWADVDEAGVPWVAIGDMSDGGVVPTTAKRVTPAGIRAARLRAIPSGTVIYSMYASVGATAVLSINAVTNQAILGLVPDSQLSSSFLYWWLTGIRSSVLSMVRSNTQSNLNAEIVRSLPLLLPSLTEQAAQTAFLDTQSQRIDALRAKAELSIERLREYRSALVSAAVAGKIDVREAALAGSGGGG